MSEPQHPAELAVPLGRRGPWFAAIWLFFLVEPLRAGWAARDTAAGVVGMVATVVFAAVYMDLWLWIRRLRSRFSRPTPDRRTVAELTLLVALGVTMTLTLGQEGTASTVYVAP